MKFNEPVTKKNKLFNSFVKPIIKEEVPVKEIIKNDWRDKYPKKEEAIKPRLENTPDDSILNRMIQLKNIDSTDNIEPKNGKMVYDNTDSCVKVVIGGVWVTVSTTP